MFPLLEPDNVEVARERDEMLANQQAEWSGTKVLSVVRG